MFPNRIKPSDLFFGQPASNFLNAANDNVTDSCLGSSQSYQHSGSSLSHTLNSQELFCDTQNSLELTEPPNSVYERYMSLKSSQKLPILPSKSQLSANISQASNLNSNNNEQLIELKNQIVLLQEIICKNSSEIENVKEKVNSSLQEHSNENLKRAAFEKVSCETFHSLSTMISKLVNSVEENKINTDINLNSLKEAIANLPNIIGEQINNLSADMVELLQKDGILINSFEETIKDLVVKKLLDFNSDFQKYDKENRKIWQDVKDRQMKLTDVLSNISKYLEVDFVEKFSELKSVVKNFVKPEEQHCHLNNSRSVNDLNLIRRSWEDEIKAFDGESVKRNSNISNSAVAGNFSKYVNNAQNSPARKGEYAIRRKPCRLTSNLVTKTPPQPLLKYVKNSSLISPAAQSMIGNHVNNITDDCKSSPCLSLDEVLPKATFQGKIVDKKTDVCVTNSSKQMVISSPRKLSTVPNYLLSRRSFPQVTSSVYNYPITSTSIISGNQSQSFIPQPNKGMPWSGYAVPHIMTNFPQENRQAFFQKPIFSTQRNTTITPHQMYQQMPGPTNDQYATSSYNPFQSFTWNDGISRAPDNSFVFHSQSKFQISPNVYGNAVPGYIAEYSRTICSPAVDLKLTRKLSSTARESKNVPALKIVKRKKGKKRKLKYYNDVSESSD